MKQKNMKVQMDDLIDVLQMTADSLLYNPNGMVEDGWKDVI